MRAPKQSQLSLSGPLPPSKRLAELRGIDEILDENPQIVDRIHADLVREIDPNIGRMGLAAEQILRILILKQVYGYAYDDLEFHLSDSPTYRWFCRMDCSQQPTKSAMQRDIKRVTPETLEAGSCDVVKYAIGAGIEKLDKVRTDCTGVETNIHEPTDSSLLYDCVRVLHRLLSHAKQVIAQIRFHNHTRRAKKRATAIEYARSNAERRPLYRDLLKVAKQTVGYAERALPLLSTRETRKAKRIGEQMKRHIELANQVIAQTRRRVLEHETVPASEKIVSIFEPHTDIIVKDRRQPIFGHKICLTAGVSGMILDGMILDGNPADSTLAVNMVRRLRDAYGRVPRQATFDGGFSSKDNIAQIKLLGVDDVVFAKSRGIKVEEMARSDWVYKRLRNFRAGIEATISFLKRAFALERCSWRGAISFQAYVWSTILAANLLIAARHADDDPPSRRLE